MNKKNHVVSVHITFKSTDASDAMKDYAEDKICRCVEKFAQSNIDVHVVLSVEKKRQIAEASFNHLGSQVKASESSEDMYKSVDLLIDTVSSQLRKKKEKATAHH